VQRVAELVEERRPIGLAAVRPQDEIHLVGHTDRRTKGPRPLPFAFPGIEGDASPRQRIDAHLGHLGADRRFHAHRREIGIELARAEHRQRVGPRELRRRHVEHAFGEFGQHVVPQRLRIAQELLALGAQRFERHPAQELEGRVVPLCELQRFGDLAFPLEAFAANRGQLAFDKRAARRFDDVSLANVRLIRDLDRQRFELNLAAVGEAHDGRSFPRDLAFVERSQLPAALRLGGPVEQQARGTLLLAARRRRAKRLEGQRQRVGPEDVRVLRIDRLEIRRRLVAGVREVVLARDLLHERFAARAQRLQGQRSPAHVSMRARMISATRSAATRSCCKVSRSRRVTVPSAIVSPSIVMQYGVPTSSWRR
jgi:hypothetical protein